MTENTYEPQAGERAALVHSSMNTDRVERVTVKRITQRDVVVAYDNGHEVRLRRRDLTPYGKRSWSVTRLMAADDPRVDGIEAESRRSNAEHEVRSAVDNWGATQHSRRDREALLEVISTSLAYLDLLPPAEPDTDAEGTLIWNLLKVPGTPRDYRPDPENLGIKGVESIMAFRTTTGRLTVWLGGRKWRTDGTVAERVIEILVDFNDEIPAWLEPYLTDIKTRLEN